MIPVADPGKMKGGFQTNSRCTLVVISRAQHEFFGVKTTSGHAHVTRENPILSQGKSHNRFA